MAARALTRWQAAGLHLAIGVAASGLFLAVVLGLWYPSPLFETSGGGAKVLLLLALAVAGGPVLTLIVYKAGKRGLAFDLVVIALLQLGAAGHVALRVAETRPVFLAFVIDRFELVGANEVDLEELSYARHREFLALSWTGPVLAAVDPPTDPAENRVLIESALEGRDAQYFHRYYVPYGERTQAVLAKAGTVARLRETEPVTARAVDAFLASTGAREADVRVLLLRTRDAWVAVLVDPRTAQPLRMLRGEAIE